MLQPAPREVRPRRHTPPATRSSLGLAWHCVRRGRAGVGAEQEYIELAVELGEPLVLFLDLVELHIDVDRWMPTCCSMDVATAAAIQGIPACCGRSTETAPRSTGAKAVLQPWRSNPSNTVASPSPDHRLDGMNNLGIREIAEQGDSQRKEQEELPPEPRTDSAQKSSAKCPPTTS